MKTLRGSGCTLTWSDDGRTIEKRYDRLSWDFYGQRHAPFEIEWRVGSLLRRRPPPVSAPRLLAADRRRRALVFEAIDGDALGPKFPIGGELDDGVVADLVALALAMPGYRADRAPFLARFDLARRLERAVRFQLVTAEVAARVRRQAIDDPPAIVFGHGDITARNVLRSSTTADAVLIDWEWAGRYPRGWDLAFLWFTLVDLPGGRASVEAAVPAADLAWFWRSALLVQLLHLSLAGLQPGSPFRPKHEHMRDELVERVLQLS
jgi:hypothetical protein